MKKTILKTGVKILYYGNKMKVENNYLIKYNKCKNPIL